MEVLETDSNLLAYYVGSVIYVGRFVLDEETQRSEFEKVTVIDLTNDTDAAGLNPEQGLVYELNGEQYYVVSYTNGVDK